MNAVDRREPEPPPLIEEGIRLTAAGVRALTDAHCPSECDLCRKELTTGDAFFRVTLGMDETPSLVGAPAHTESTVEEMSEIIVCYGCAPAVSAPLERLLATIWEMRKADPNEPEDELAAPAAPATERSP